MFLRTYHLSGNVKYSGWIKGNPYWKRREQKIYDVGGLMLHLFEGEKVIVMDEKGNKIDQGFVKEGKITKYLAVNDLLTDSLPEDYEENSILSSSELSSSILSRQYTDDGDDSSSDSDLLSEIDDDFNIKNIFIYDGEMFDEMPNGKGVLKKNGQVVYDGNFLDGEKHGIGTSFIENKKIHYGEYLEGEFHGQGNLYHPDTKEMIFVGKFKKGFPFCGKFYCNNSIVYEGSFKNFFGKFAFFYDDKIYIGEFKNGKRNGFGKTLNLKDNTVYEGYWKNDLYHGKGVLMDKFGLTEYDGLWKNGLKDGYGILYEKDFLELYKYIGDFKEDKKEGYGILYESEKGILYEIEKYNDRSSWLKEYSGWWKNNEKNGDALCYNSDKLFYEGEMKDGYEDGFGNRFYQDGTLQYRGCFKEDDYHGQGILFYIDGTVCFEGIFKKGNPCNGTFYNFEDGSVHPTKVINGDYYTKGVLIEPETDGTIYHRGSFKNGLFHGDAISKDYKGTFKDGKFHGKGTYYSKWINKKYTGQFINGFFWDGKTLRYVDTNVIVYEGTIKNEKYDTGIETIFEDDDDDYDFNNPIGYRKWKNGEIVNEKEERHYLRQKMLISSFLETKNKKTLTKIYKKDYLNYLKEKYNISNVESKTKKQLVQIIKKENEKENENTVVSNEPEQFDLFGNEIVNPVQGFDGETYDESSMKYLFQRNDKNDFVNIGYIYNESNKRVPNYPIMANGKILNGYINEVVQVYEFPSQTLEIDKKSLQSYCDALDNPP